MSEETISPQEILVRYISGPDKLQAAIAGLSDKELDSCCAPGEWTIRQVVHHLADGDDIWSMCIKVALGAPGSTFCFDWYPGNEPWAARFDYAGRAVEPAVALLRAHRLHLAQLLEYLPDGWERSVTVVAPYQPQQEEMTVGTIVGLLARHVEQHVEQVQEIRAKNGL
jgi:uncharacterized damage-inducible protein DinB